ncbi:OLC1v1018355C1 [Oldenlandia corymbosa var. corymbosa]|uniref:OLC1v1018355C1 n=1 Tax=Oldenlandia corymbosa var. corymbosa TaxID=529605 RepID=A0AAV1EBG6_OLDCO|nr:OLC1v1018355C1 [Oldenlandia corymbosa var. corymbosa]
MATVADSSTPSGGGGADGAANSPQSRRRNLQSPWAQVVRGVEPESSSATVSVAAPRSPSSSPPLAAAVAPLAPEQSPQLETENSSAPESQPENSDDGNGNGNGGNAVAARSKRPAWSKPLNGLVVEGTSVMGDVSWPALAEASQLTGKSSSDSLKAQDGSTSSSQGPIISQMPPKQQANTNANSNSAANHGNTTRPRPARHHRAGPAAQGVNLSRPSPPTPPPMPPPFPAIIEMPHYRNFGNFVPPPVLDPPVRGVTRPMSGVGSNDHSAHPQRNTSRRNNFGRPRGEYHNHHGGRRDHDRRDVHLPNQYAPPPPPPPPGGYMPAPTPPSPGSAPFIPAPPMRPYVGPMTYDMPPPPHPYIYVPTLPYITPPPSQQVFFPVMDPSLPTLILRQIDYYFSDANLVKDDYLRSNMDEEGWVPVSLIASFPRVQQLTVDIPLILESLKASPVVEIKDQGDKIRRRNDWRKWIHTSGGQISADSGSSQTPGTSSDDVLTSSISKISLNEETSCKGPVLETPKSETETARNIPTPDDSVCSSSVVANGDVTTADEELHAN